MALEMDGQARHRALLNVYAKGACRVNDKHPKDMQGQNWLRGISKVKLRNVFLIVPILRLAICHEL